MLFEHHSSDTMGLLLLDHLPFELVLRVFAFAAASSKETALVLSRTSSDIRRFVAQYLYCTVILRSSHQVSAFLELIIKSRESSKACINPASYVRNLCITHHAPGRMQCADGVIRDPYTAIFESCKGICRVALQSTFLHSSLVPYHPLHTLVCKEVMVLGPTFPSDWEKHADAISMSQEDKSADFVSEDVPSSILKYTTRLHLLEYLSSPHFSGLQLTQLPCLTHIALLIREQTYSANPFFDLEALLSSPRIQMIVISLDLRIWNTKSLDEWADLAKQCDERLYVVKRDMNDPLHQWEDCVNCRGDIWDRAVREREEREKH